MASLSPDPNGWGPGTRPAPGDPREIWRQVRLIAVVQSKISSRRFRLSVRETPEGKLAVVALLTLPIFTSSLVRSAYRLPHEASVDEATGVLVLATIFTALGVALGSASIAIRSLALERGDEALRAFPAFRGGLAVHHMAFACVGSNSLYMIGTFIVLYAPTALVVPPGPWIGLPLVLMATIAFSFLLGIRAYRAAVRWIDVHPGSARTVQVVTGLLSVLTFVGLPLLPRPLLRQWPGAVESIGAAVSPSGLWIVVPIVAAVALSAAALWTLRREVLETSKAPPPVIWNGVPVLGSGVYRSTFASLVRGPRHRARLWRLFLAKEVLLPWSRDPGRLIRECLLTIAFLGTGAALAELSLQHVPDQALTLSVVSMLAFSLVSISAVSVYRGAGCIGVEAPMLRILRPALGLRDLWVHKARANLASVVPHGMLGAIALWVGLTRWGELPQLPNALLILSTAALSFPMLGVAVGFAFPRLDAPGGGMIPGSTTAGKTVGAGVMLFSSGVALVLTWMGEGGIMPRALIPSTVLASTCLVLGVTAVLSVFGILRLMRLDL